MSVSFPTVGQKSIVSYPSAHASIPDAPSRDSRQMPGKVPKFKAEQCLALQDEHAVGMLKRKLLDKSNNDQPLWSTVADRIDLCRHDDASQVLRRVVEEASNRSIFPLGDRRRQHTIPIAGEKPPVQSSSGYAGSSGWGSTPSS